MNTARIALAVGLLLMVGPVAVSGTQAALHDEVTPASEVLVGIQGPGHNGKVAVVGQNGTEWVTGGAGSYHAVSRLPNGSVLTTFVEPGVEDCGRFPAPCARTGVRILDPSPEPRTVWEWSYVVRSMGNSEVHDAEVLPSGNIVIADMEYESIFILDPETGERVWTWNASSVYPAPADPTRTDWLHINDVDYIGDGRFLVSVRNANQLLIIKRGEGVVEVVNKEGDPDLLRRQHNPQWLGDGAVLVSDSSNDRVVELHRQPDGTWKPVWTLSEANGIEFAWPRDADRLPNGHTLITDSRNHRVLEVTRQGEVVASWRTPKLPYEADVRGGEQVGGPEYGSGLVFAPGTGEQHMLLIGDVYLALHHSVGLPYWISEYHLLSIFAGFGFVLVGLGSREQD